MSPQQYRDTIARLGLTQVAAGKFLDCEPRTLRRWASGESPIPKAVAMLLQLMVRMKLEPEDMK